MANFTGKRTHSEAFEDDGKEVEELAQKMQKLNTDINLLRGPGSLRVYIEPVRDHHTYFRVLHF